MSDDDRTLPLGHVWQNVYLDALAQYAKEHARGREPELVLSEDVESVTLTINLARRKPNYCYIEVAARKPWDAATYGYRFLALGQQLAADSYQRVL